MEDIFGEKKLWNPSVIISILLIVTFMVISIGGAF